MSDTYNIGPTVPGLFAAHESRFKEAADEIDRLRAERNHLRAELAELFDDIRRATNREIAAGTTIATLRAELEKLSRNDLPGMCEAFDRVIEAYHSKTHPFHNPVAADAHVALRVLRGICSTITALREGGKR